MSVEEANNIILNLPFSSLEKPFKLENDGSLTGDVGILAEGMSTKLVFHSIIYNSYPYKIQGKEPITFYNESLIDYPHIMTGGSLCLHSSYWTDSLKRLESDVKQLHDWVVKYYVQRKFDIHYEHLVVENMLMDDQYYAFHFTDLDKDVQPGEYGIATVSYLKDGIHQGKVLKNYFLKSIGRSKNNNDYRCSWNDDYMSFKHLFCPYMVLSTIPCTHGKFAVDNYEELNKFLSQDQLNFLHNYESLYLKHYTGFVIPLLFGYRIPTGELHWLASISKIGQLPTIGKPQIKEGVKTGKWLCEFQQERIIWAMSYNSSYNLFFGRGAFREMFTHKRILILGIGAIGSIVAKTFTRCGCKNLAIYDFDIKKPENVCRSEYHFLNGATDKIAELSQELSATSPHLTIHSLPESFEWAIKHANSDGLSKTYAEEALNQFDIIFDCTTDNDLMGIFENLDLKPEIVNLSITNHASELVCAFSPNISHFVNTIFGTVLHSDESDMFEPTGCWNPTFKASYNDIALMVQYAIRHIYKMLCNISIKQNFVLRDTEDGLKIIKY